MSKKTAFLFILLLALSLTACERAASTPLPTMTLDANFPSVPTTSMDVIEQAGTQTAVAAGTPVAAGTQPAEAAVIPTFTPLAGLPQTPVIVDPAQATLQASGAAALPSPTPDGSAALVTPAAALPTSVPPARPATYTLQAGEFPYCIARRYNLNPDELLSLNGITNGQIVMPGLVLQIPQTSSVFPANRALLAHPTTYTVRSNETIYSIACAYGDVDPMSIASANALQSPYTLTAGAQLNIP